MQGIVIYDKNGYEDGGEFPQQVEDLVESNRDIELSMDSDMSFGISNGSLYVKLSSGKVLTADSDELPRWAMMRSSDWECALVLEKLGVRTFPSSDYIRVASDKVLSHLVMSDCFDMLDMACIRNAGHNDNLIVPGIMKSASGFGGKSVTRVESMNEAVAAITMITNSSECAISQQLASSPDDLRVYLLGGKVVLSVLRRAAREAVTANLSAGAQGELYELTNTQTRMIEDALTDKFPDNMGFVSVDFLFDSTGSLVFNEMNCFPGITILSVMGNETKNDFVQRYVKLMEDCCRQEGAMS